MDALEAGDVPLFDADEALLRSQLLDQRGFYYHLHMSQFKGEAI